MPSAGRASRRTTRPDRVSRSISACATADTARRFSGRSMYRAELESTRVPPAKAKADYEQILAEEAAAKQAETKK
jgi:hypothetical protein